MDYYQGYEDAMRQARISRTNGLIGFVLRLMFSLAYSAFIYVPLLILSFYLAQSFSSFYSNDIYIKIGLTVIIAYLLFGFIYFLKGVLIGLRNDGRSSWIVVWLLCVILTCGAQAIIAQTIFEDLFAGRNIANHLLWSWIGAAIVAIVIYSHYRFLTNVAPGSVFWSYRLGFLAVITTKITQSDQQPKKSGAYFENAPMSVSFKK